MHRIRQELKDRRLIEWMLVYVAGAWLVVEVVQAFGPGWGLSASGHRAIHASLILGFFVALVVTWFHGARGRQTATGPELLLLALLLMLASLVLPLVVDGPFLAPSDPGQSDGREREGDRPVGVGEMISFLEPGQRRQLGYVPTALEADREAGPIPPRAFSIPERDDLPWSPAVAREGPHPRCRCFGPTAVSRAGDGRDGRTLGSRGGHAAHGDLTTVP